MNNKVFRRVSLERLASPEQLDQTLTVTSSKGWLSLIAIGGMLLTALLWGVMGSIPSKVNGEGILISGGGIISVVQTTSGQVTDIRIAEGDMVKAGQTVMRVAQPELVTSLNDLKKKLAELKQLKVGLDNTGATGQESFFPELKGIYDLQRSIRETRASFEVQKALAQDGQSQAKQAQLRLKQAELSLEAAEKEYENFKKLYGNQAISQAQLNQAQDQLRQAQIEKDIAFSAWEQLGGNKGSSVQSAQLKQSALMVANLEKQLVEMERELEKTKQKGIEDTEQEIEKVKRDLETGANVTAPVDGRVLEVRVTEGSLIQPGSPIVVIEKMGGNQEKLEVVVYVPAEEGKKIQPGMDAQISPTIIKKEEYGYMLGKVTTVSKYPATSSGMLATLGSQELAQKMSQKGAPIEVRVDLIVDESYLSGYRWSSQDGPPVNITSGTMITGSIIVSEQKPIRLVVPKIKEYLPF